MIRKYKTGEPNLETDSVKEPTVDEIDEELIPMVDPKKEEDLTPLPLTEEQYDDEYNNYLSELVDVNEEPLEW